MSARELIASGDLLAGQQMLDDDRRLQRYDCRVDAAPARLAAGGWAAEHGIRPGSRPIDGAASGPDVPASPLAEALLAPCRRPAAPSRTRRPDRAGARRRRHRLPPARAQELLVGALRPAGRSRSRSGKTPATCSSSTQAVRVERDWHRERQPPGRPAHPAAARRVGAGQHASSRPSRPGRSCSTTRPAPFIDPERGRRRPRRPAA